MARQTQKERNERTRRALLDAGAELLREVGYAGTSVARITRRANRAHGTFYLHFDNKRHLMSVLLDDMVDEARRSIRDTWRTDPTVETVWLSMRSFLSRITDERSLWSVLDEVVAVEEDAAPMRSGLRRLYTEPVLRRLERRPGDLTSRGANLELVADIVASAGLHFARTSRLPASPDVVALHITVVWCSAIGRRFTTADLEHLTGLFATQ